MIKKKQNKPRIHKFDWGGNTGFGYGTYQYIQDSGLQSEMDAIGNRMNASRIQSVSDNAPDLSTIRNPYTEVSSNSGASSTKKEDRGGGFNTSGIAYADMFDKIAQGVTTGIDSNRRGASDQPLAIVEGVLGAQSGSHLGSMWSTEAKTKEALDYVKQQGNVGYTGTDTNSLLTQYGNTGYMQHSNIDTRGKELEDFIFDPASYLITSISGKRKTADERQREINAAIDQANARRLASFENAISNFDTRRQQNMMANYSAFGGPIDVSFGGAIGYDVAKDNSYAKQLKAQSTNSTTFSPMFTSPSYEFAEGGGIYIKPSKRGTFTAAAKKRGMGVQEFASKVLANKEDYSPAMVKKANFARNAAKWHADGGMLMSDNFDNGVLIIGQGGTHENNPHEGVQVGIAPDGAPNLVEQGEAIYDDYVFSNRLRVPKEVRNKYKLRGPKDMTFAEAFINAQKESEERPNDPISENGLDSIAIVLARTQEAVRGYKDAVHSAATGGHLFKRGSRKYNYNEIFNNKSYAAANDPTAFLPYDRKMTKDAVKALEDEQSYKDFTDYVIENWDDEDVQAYLKSLDAKAGGNHLFDAKGNVKSGAKDYFRKGRTDQTMGYYHLTPGLLAEEDVIVDVPDAELSPRMQYAVSGTAPDAAKIYTSTSEVPAATLIADVNGNSTDEVVAPQGYKVPSTGIGYTLPVAQGVLALTDDFGVTNRYEPLDYVPGFTPIPYHPIGNYVPITHTDTRYQANQLGQQAAATRNAIMQSTAPSRWANMLAADYNAQIGLGDVLRQGELQDYNMMLQREQFNRGTDQYNADDMTRVDTTNQAKRLDYAQAALQQGRLNREEQNMLSAARAQNIGNFAETLDDLKRERYNREMLQMLVDSGAFGTLPTAANGGKISSKKKSKKSKKGLTY